jgi:preprotein translocase subunit SecG
METLIWIVHLLVAITLIGLILLQHGKGADMGAAFGSGASGSLFGASGSANFLSRTTAILATVFFVTSMGLTYFSLSRTKSDTVLEKIPASAPSAPATPSVPVPSGGADNSKQNGGEIPR